MRKPLREFLFMLGLGLGVLLCALRPLGVYAAQFTNPIDGYTLTYPDTSNANLSDRTIIVRSFPVDQIPYRAVVPAGGARILVHSYPPYDDLGFPQGSDDYAALDKIARGGGDTLISQTDPSSGRPARVTHVDLFNTRYVDTVIHKGGRVFRILLECSPDDSHISAYEQALDNVIASITLTGATPAPVTPTP